MKSEIVDELSDLEFLVGDQLEVVIAADFQKIFVQFRDHLQERLKNFSIKHESYDYWNKDFLYPYYNFIRNPYLLKEIEVSLDRDHVIRCLWV